LYINIYDNYERNILKIHYFSKKESDDNDNDDPRENNLIPKVITNIIMESIISSINISIIEKTK